MFELLGLFIFKCICNALENLKDLFLIKGKVSLSALMDAVAGVAFLLVADKMLAADGDAKIVILAVIFAADFLGGVIPTKILEMVETPKRHEYTATVLIGIGGEIVRLLLEQGLHPECDPVTADPDRDGRFEASLNIKVVTSNKRESRIADKTFAAFKVNPLIAEED